jgi:hypothetical protein
MNNNENNQNSITKIARSLLIMNNQSKVLDDRDILSEFEKRAIKIIEDNKKHFLQYNDLLGNAEFEADQDTMISILDKYEREKNINFAHLVGYEEFYEFLGNINIEGIEYQVYEDLFDTEEGTNVIKKILDLIDIEYGCSNCLVKDACKVTEHRGDCEGADELFNNQFIYSIMKSLLDFM